jgi:hypothetical protein
MRQGRSLLSVGYLPRYLLTFSRTQWKGQAVSMKWPKFQAIDPDALTMEEGTDLLRKLHPPQKILKARLIPQLIKNWIDT